MTNSKGYFLVVVLFVMCFWTANSQLTFTTDDWSKRNGGGGGGPLSSIYSDGEPINCKTSLDTMLVLYRLIQNEAHRAVICHQDK